MDTAREKAFKAATKTVGGIITSVSDDRLYRTIVLPNKLNVLLIHDHEADMVGASMEVNVGSFNDPQEIPGLAHFLEHMLFLGTEKYPDEADYGKFVEAHGGYSNAWTADEATNYRFTVTHGNLDEGLDRFSQFFIAPLFTNDCTHRELNAVDSEHNKNLQDDYWRSNQLLKQLAAPDHPMSWFNVGNIETLETAPPAKGIDLRQSLLDFHRKYYSANLMSLCVLGRDSLDDMEKMVTTRFSGIKNYDIPVPTCSPTPYGSRECCKVIKYIPVKEARKLKVAWLMPTQREYTTMKPLGYISNLLGHESAGSVLSLLKAKGWANSLYSGGGAEAVSFSLFEANIDLTEDGLVHVDDIILIIYQYIGMMLSSPPQEWFYDEVSKVCSMGLQFKQKSSNIDSIVSKYAGYMHEYDMKYWIAGESAFLDFDANVIETLTKRLHPDNAVVVISDPLLSHGLQEERWYGTKYAMSEIPTATLDRWRAPGVNSELHFPIANEFIADDFTLLPLDPSIDASRFTHDDQIPELIVDDKAGGSEKLWWLQDAKFKMPKTFFSSQLRSPLLIESPRAQAFALVFVGIIDDYLNKNTYYAEMANLNYSIKSSFDNIFINVDGFSQRTLYLLGTVLKAMREATVSLPVFDRIITDLRRRYKNQKMQAPYNHIFSEISTFTSSKDFHWTLIRDTLAAFTIDDFNAMRGTHLQSFSIQSFAMGNITKEGALEMHNLVRSVLRFELLPESSLFFKSEIKLREGTEYIYRSDCPNDEDSNAASSLYLQIGEVSPSVEALARIIQHLVNEPFYDDLRTHQQLGYLVWTYHVVRSGIVYLCFLIQSDKVSASEVDKRMEDFIEKWDGTLSTMTEEEWTTNVSSLVVGLREKLKNQKAVFNRYLGEITTNVYRFTKEEEIAQAMEALSLPLALDFYRTFIKRGASRRRKLAVQMFSCKMGHGNARKSTAALPPVGDDSVYVIESIFGPKSEPYYPPYNHIYLSNWKKL